jgi:anhydro-N-acetylmuramic acid kinase
MKEFFSQLNKAKNRRYLVLSAGGPQGGVQGIYFAVEDAKWSILAQALIPYPLIVEETITTITQKPGDMVPEESLRSLDFKISQLFLECAKTVCANAQKSLQQPHAIVMNKLSLLKEQNDHSSENIEIGDALLVSSWFKVPVITDFVRNSLRGGKSGELPLFPGISKILADKEAIVTHLTIGMLAHLFIYDTHARHIVLDANTGPGTCLINKAASEAKCPDRFDRDGSASAQGKVDAECLEILASQECLFSSSQRPTSQSEIMRLYDHPRMADLAPLDRLATFTALTARSAFDIFKRDFRHVEKSHTMWVSGGGANNLTLLDFLSTYFAPLQVQRIDEMGIPAELFVPLALGLTVDAICRGEVRLKSGNNPDFNGIGTWLFS